MAQIGNCCNDQIVGVNDALCFTIVLDDTDGTAIDLWNDATTFVINGTIMVENNGTIGVAPTASLTVNGTPVGGFIVEPGEARSITMNDINSIGIVGAGGTPVGSTANVKVSFSLNYKF
ncbi:DUF3992 domain-containing protein [Peribacillus sp. NPDC096379]|uniref:DUF3992 domain-containing protein n=1 Tax=Peribacillus sp. NPDC096379 TaxID=3364393 RepID=UPI0038141325